MERWKWHLEPRILILFLVLGIVPPVLGHFILVSGARDIYLEQTGAHLSRRADDVQRELANLIEHATVQVANLAHSEPIRQILAASELNPAEEARFEERVRAIEQAWGGLGEEAPRLKSILGHPVSGLLRQLGEIVPTFREILLTDRYGQLVAATNKTSDYYQADEVWWQRAALQGQGARFVGDIIFDESANTYGMELAEPVRDLETGKLVGVIKAILDSSALFGKLEAANEGVAGEETLLVRTDGTSIWSPDARTRNDFAIQMSNAIRLGRLYATGSDRNGEPNLVAFPSTGIKHRIPELDWYVLVHSPMNSVLTPFENLDRRFLFIVLATVVTVIGLAFVFTHILSRPALDVDPHFERIRDSQRDS